MSFTKPLDSRLRGNVGSLKWNDVLKWILVLVVATILIGLFAPQLRKLGLWRLPGDFRFRRNGREYFIPVTSTVLICVVLTLVLRVLRV